MNKLLLTGILSLIGFTTIWSQWTDHDLGSFIDFNAVTIHSNGDVFLSGDNGTLKVSTDCGNTWEDVTLDFDDDIGAIQFVNENLGFMVADDGYFAKTEDGGASWAFGSTPAPDNLQALHFLSSQVGYMVGRDGAIVKTTDGGNSWELQVSGSTNRLEAVHFFDEEHGIVTGRDNTLLYTEDGGASWANMSATTSGDLKGIAFYGENGIIAGEGSVYIISPTLDVIDEVFISADAEFNSVVFDSAGVAWLCGSGPGQVQSSEDFGQTWVDQIIPVTAYELESIAAGAQGVLFTVGELSTVMSTCDVASSAIGESSLIEINKLFINAGEDLEVHLSSHGNLELLLGVYDLQGKPVTPLRQLRFTEGQETVSLELPLLPAGYYQLVLSGTTALAVRLFRYGVD
jgi:photosystem II stability/assembly factor-like uncharacterized protein